MAGARHTFAAFAGAVPRRDSRLLDQGYGTVCTNYRVSNGALVPLRTLGIQTSPTKSGQQIALHLLRTPTQSIWLTWSRAVEATPSPRTNDDSGRTYIVLDGEPRVTDYTLATTGGTDYPEQFYVHGVFPPQTAPGAAVTGGSGTAVSRTFRYTFVNQWDEESAPSPVSTVVNGFLNSTSWDLTSLQTAPPNSYAVTGASWSSGVATYTVSSTRGLRVGEEMTITGMTPAGYNIANAPITALTSTTVSFAVAVNPGAFSAGGTITRDAPHNTTGWRQRFYVTDSSGVFKFWAEQAAATTYSAAVTEANLQSSTYADGWRQNIFYDMPPTDMHSVVVGWNGMMFGATKDELIIFEPYKPHAAPTLYRIPIPFEVVGIGVTGQAVVIATKGNPYLARGSSPLSMSNDKHDGEWPCVAKRSIAAGPLGVLYATRNGLILGNGGGFQLITRDLYTYEQWRLLQPETFVASVHDDTYYAAFSGMANHQPQSGIVIIPIVEKVLATMFADFVLTALKNDPATGNMYVLFDSDVYRWDDPSGTRLRGQWVSKEVLYSHPINMGAARVDAEFLISAEENDALEAAYAAALLANHILLGSTFVITGTTANGSTQITGLSSTADLVIGMYVSGTNVPAGATVVSVDSASAVTISAACTGAGTNSMTFQASIVRNGTTASGSAVVTGLPSTASLFRGMRASASAGIPAGTYVFSVDSATQVTLTAQATATGARDITFLGTPEAVSGAVNAAGINTYDINGDGLSDLPSQSFEELQFQLYTEGALRATRALERPLRAFRLPSGYKSLANKYGISGNVVVRTIEVAETMEGLKQI